eukprot:7893607-Alexandrium_andersonii.AAC.1
MGAPPPGRSSTTCRAATWRPVRGSLPRAAWSLASTSIRHPWLRRVLLGCREGAGCGAERSR